jgi:hypothetical protein
MYALCDSAILIWGDWHNRQRLLKGAKETVEVYKLGILLPSYYNDILVNLCASMRVFSEFVPVPFISIKSMSLEQRDQWFMEV